ncbi:MAG: hypothetical protein LOD91_09760, partial [Limnochordales bacterium]
AHALGLVDHLGGLEQAVAVAAELAGLKERPVLVPLRKPRSLYDRLLGLLGDAVVRALAGQAPTGAWALALGRGQALPDALELLGVPPWGYRLR